MRIVKRLGSNDVDDQVRQAVASVTLEGLKPTERSVELVRAVAEGKITGEDALKEMRAWYMSDSDTRSGHKHDR